GSGCAGGDGLVLFAAGLPEVDVHVDQARTHNLTGRIQDPIRGELRLGTDADNVLVAQPQVCNLIQPLYRVNNPAVSNATDAHAEDCNSPCEKGYRNHARGE